MPGGFCRAETFKRQDPSRVTAQEAINAAHRRVIGREQNEVELVNRGKKTVVEGGR